MSTISPSARVFICSSTQTQDEVHAVQSIATNLKRVGLEPYIAVEAQTMAGLRESAFRGLSESEYFILVDFKRERLYDIGNGSHLDTEKHRGSLFHHQAFAIAAFLNIESVVFREKETKEDDGILKFHSNHVEFWNRSELPELVIKYIRELKWNPSWRNQVVLERMEEQFEDVPRSRLPEYSHRCYHIGVRNLHRDKIAHDCVAYLESVKSLSSGREIPIELLEFKWKDLTVSRVAIPPLKSRDFQVFHVRFNSPSIAYLGVNQQLLDTAGYAMKYAAAGPGDFELKYVVFSENFPPARATFTLRLGNTLEEVKFSLKEKEPA